MTIFDSLLGRKKTTLLIRTYRDQDIVFTAAGGNANIKTAREWLTQASLFDEEACVRYLDQLLQEELAETNAEKITISWTNYYELEGNQEHKSNLPLLGLPAPWHWCPALHSHRAVSDPDFQVNVTWATSERTKLKGNPQRTGGIIAWQGQHYLLPATVWCLLEALDDFAVRPISERTQGQTEILWGDLRTLAIHARAELDQYLARTVVLNPKQLELRLRKASSAGMEIVEVVPGIPGVPENLWIKQFDAYRQVRDSYDVFTDGGERIRVHIQPDAKKILAEIRAFPGRRLTGKRAQQFLRNPYALLGKEMERVIPEETFEKARRQAQIHFYDFDVSVDWNKHHRVDAALILLQPRDEIAPPLPALRLSHPQMLEEFLKTLRQGVAANENRFVWGHQEIEIRGDTTDHIAALESLLTAPWGAPPLASFSQIGDLGRYAERVVGIGEHKPVYSLYLASKDQDLEAWIPESLEIATFTPPGSDQSLNVAVTPQRFEHLKSAIENAKKQGQESIHPAGWPAPLSLEEAERLSAEYEPFFHDPANFMRDAIETTRVDVTPELPTEESVSPPEEQPEAKLLTLLIQQNIALPEYIEERQRQLRCFDRDHPPTPRLPAVFRSDRFSLLEHQMVGVAWLQFLWGLTESSGVRGALLADDMGLGKTLQLLCFIAWYLEQAENPEPVLVIAPVSLLENWQIEIARFFDENFQGKVRRVYGDALSQYRIRPEQMDDDLQGQRIQLLREGWREGAQIILTTYETLRDQEISFGAERWSILICDEAQKIKTPGTLVTHAAKAQHARFKIACTGTPVENSLTDLWCLFDFIQPGLLGALNDFSRRYRRPIETQLDNDRQALDELRTLIEPQLLRRMKTEVKKDLPAKIIEQSCRTLPLSEFQLTLYRHVQSEYVIAREAQTEIDDEQENKNELEKEKEANPLLRMLHQLRQICADPRDLSLKSDLCTQSTREARQKSPKLGWLIDRLGEIRTQSEKAIIFTDFRDIQLGLQHHIELAFGRRPAIVNGSTKTTTTKRGGHSRQSIIDDFQSLPGFNVLILGTTAMGVGVNIVGANHVIHYTRAWNPAKEDQATDRAYRIGQTRPVYVYYPTVTSPHFVTFEAKLDFLLDSKRNLSEDIFNGIPSLTMDDWKDLQTVTGNPAYTPIRVLPKNLEHIEARAFERLCLRLWQQQDYTTYPTPTIGDGGIDVVAINRDTGRGCLIQCKTSVCNHSMGWDAVKDVVTGAAAYEYRHPEIIFQKIAVTNQYFGPTAHKQAQLNAVELLEQPHLIKLLEQYEVTL